MLTRLQQTWSERGLRRARDAAARGDFERAATEMTHFLEHHDRPDLEAELVSLRNRGFLESEHAEGLASWPPLVPQILDPVPGQLAEITRDELTSDVLRDGILRHGSLVVRGLLSNASAARLRDAVACSYEARDRHAAGTSAPDDSAWYSPFQPAHGHGFSEINREWYRAGGGLLAADSPRGLRVVLDECRRSGILDVVTSYLGERPALSVLKTTLRCIPADMDAENGWHQDGAFLGDSIRTVNLWVALSPCGITAPSLDIVPGRLREIVATGTAGAAFDWSVSSQVIADVSPPTGPVRAMFEPGDAIMFDEMNLHRTGTSPGMTDNRYALEAWFFAPSVYPMPQIPLLV